MPRLVVRATAALIVYSLLSAATFWSALSSPTTRLIGHGGSDTQLVMWLLNWTPFALVRHLNPFFTDYLNWPAGVSLLWNGWLPLHGLALWPVTSGPGPVAAYNVLMAGSVALSAWSAFLAIAYLSRSGWGAFAGGLLYGFSPYMLAHSFGHPSLTFAVVPPLLLVLFRETVARRDWPPIWLGVLVALAALVQLASSEELLATEAVVALAALLLLLQQNRNRIRLQLLHAVTVVAVAAGLFLTVAAAPLYLQFFGPGRIFGSLHGGNDVYETDLLNFVVPTEVQALAPGPAIAISQNFTGNVTEWNGYLGLPLILILLWVARTRWENPLIKLCTVFGLGAAVMSMGPLLHVGGQPLKPVFLPFLGVLFLPVLKALLANRLMIYAYLFASVLLADFVASTIAGDRARKGIGLVVLFLAAVTLLPRIPFPTDQVVPLGVHQQAFDGLVEDGGVALLLPYADALENHAEYWQASTGMRFHMPEGYFLGGGPGGQFIDSPVPTETSRTLIGIQRGRPSPPLTPALRDALLADLARWRVEAVILGPMPEPGRGTTSRLITFVLCQRPREVGGVQTWKVGGRTDCSGLGDGYQ